MTEGRLSSGAASAGTSGSPATGAAAPNTSSGGTRGWVKALLALSLALNLAVAGLAAGAFLRFGGPPPRVERDFGLGPVTAVMTREDWHAVGPAFMASHPDLKSSRGTLRPDFEPLVALLRATEFDAAALRAAMFEITERNAARLDTVRQVIADYLIAMPVAQRLEFADRLEARILETQAASDARRKQRQAERAAAPRPARETQPGAPN